MTLPAQQITPHALPDEAVTQALTGRNRGRARAARQGHRSAYWMVAPATLLLLLFLVVPVLLAFGLSFTNARLISPNPPRFVGGDNFVRAFTQDPTFLRSLVNTFIFAVVVVPVQSALALGMAVLVNRKLRGVTLFRIIYFIPVVTSIVVISVLWEFMYQRDGLINALLSRVSGGALEGADWLNDTRTALGAIIVLSIWQAVGFHMIIWLSGLQTIPEELYEAARMDGANGWQQFRSVTWPGLRSTMVFILVTITIQALGLFAQIDVMTQGGPLDTTTTLVYHAVQQGYRRQETGYGAAISLIFFVIVLVIALVQRWLTREKD
ncbi:carbohydrate ABC transporter permease [Actinotalea sp. JY-7885]|uniref:carbohydrate ABC transporter permease n=1 Tax=Actinotalea sp. JY-7885 TaxID=2758576 RepID=UPI0021083C59|nr:sugar ABC transporter permease [Actinotalea sp. JY-7885]